MNRYLTDLNELPEFFMFPKVLLCLDLTYTEAAVYMLLLDRSRISAVNEGWRDALDRVFLYYPVRSLAVALRRSETAVKNALKALEEKGLIHRLRQGLGKPDRIYVRLPEYRRPVNRGRGQRRLLTGGSDGLSPSGQDQAPS